MKSNDTKLDFVELGRERQTNTFRSRLNWGLLGMSLLGIMPTVLFCDEPGELLILIGSIIAASIATPFVVGMLMEPIDVLRRRLEFKNYGVDGDPGPPVKVDAFSIDSDGFELGVFLASLTTKATINMAMDLPVELSEIERLARAGRATDVAMESVRRDLFRHISHQLKTPLALMKSHAESAANAADSNDANAIKRSMDSISSLCLNTSGLIEQMLSMSWVDSMADQGVSSKRANISAGIMSITKLRERAASEKGISIVTNVAAGLWVKGHSDLLSEMIAALLDNAIYYGPEGSEIEINAAKLPGTMSAVVIVRDHGPGIPLQERERVFEPFYGSIGVDARGNMTYGTRRHRALGGGTGRTSHGLGLALVKAVAKLHGADITLDDRHGGGLLVQIVLSGAEPPPLID